MKRLLWISAALASLLAGACAENQPATTSERVPVPAVSAVQPPVQTGGVASLQVPGSSSLPKAPVPPAGAQWTIYCASFRGPDHVLVANHAKEELLQQSHMNGWYIVHHADESILYYGYYTVLGSPQGKADKHAIEAMGNSDGERQFAASMFVQLSSPNPSAPPEWDLANTPPDMYWSLQIAAFVQTADRKERAVEAVREARAEGIEAYYYHGESISSVCIGAWPRTAVRQQDAGGIAHNNNADVPVIVANQPIPDGSVPRLHDNNGNPVPIIAPKLTVDDPKLQKAIDQYPDHAVNGMVMTQRDKNGKEIPASSFLVEIPHHEALLRDDADAVQRPGSPVSPVVPADVNDATLGKLRSTGEH